MFLAEAISATSLLKSAPSPQAPLDELQQSLDDDVLSRFYPACVDTLYGGYLAQFNADYRHGERSHEEPTVSQSHPPRQLTRLPCVIGLIPSTVALRGMA